MGLPLLTTPAFSDAATRWGHLRQLVALSAFAIAQPLLGLLAGHSGFLVAHWVMPVDLLLLLAALFLAVPLALAAIERTLGLASRLLESLAHHVCVVGLCTLIALPILNRFLAQTSAPMILVAAAPGVVLALCLVRFARVRESIEFLAAAPLIFLLVFFATPDTRALALQFRATVIESPSVANAIPVVVVVFDELPLTSLLDPEGEVDAKRFPNFAQLAQSATWFRNATTVTSYTQQAVPAILTGRYPGTEPRLAIASEHPRNLFSLLGGSHSLNVFESQMQLGHPDVLSRPALAQRMRALFDDLFVLYLHMILPDTLTTRLPNVSETWGGFGAGAAIPAQLGGTDATPRVNHPAEFRRFVEAVARANEADRPALHFIHSVMPHRPWQYMPSGKVYFPYAQRGVEKGFGTTAGEWWQQEGYQRHLLQLVYVDALLGELIRRLQTLDAYDSALIVVTADHGVGFWPDDNARIVGLSAHPEDILSVPLFIKRPGQIRGEVRIDNVESIDILPTIADVVGAQIGAESAAPGDADSWRFDGCSLFDASCPKRPDKRAYSSPNPTPRSMRELRFEPTLGLRTESLERKTAWFGESLYAFGPYRELVGKSLATLDVRSAKAGTVFLDEGPRPAFHDPSEERLPARISGRLVAGVRRRAPAQVAIAVAGSVQTIVPAEPDTNGDRRVLAMIPETSLVAAGHSPSERVSMYLVEGPPEAPQLTPLVLTPGDPSK